MNLAELHNAIPDCARDIKLNLDSVLSQTGATGLDGLQVRAVALASCAQDCA